tara:strand:- start:330 stop:635 length:306 start_codon:yes stop_codon:yes gene_type:complete
MATVFPRHDVIKAWLAGNPARTQNHSLSTDGEDLYSYRLLIGYKSANGRPMVKDYRAPNNVSQTTSVHVGMAIAAINDPGAVRDPFAPMVTVAKGQVARNS